MAQGTAKNSTSVKSQASPSAKCVQTKKQSKQSLQAKTPPMQSLRSRRLEREDTSATEDPIVGHEPGGRNSTYHLSAIARQREAEDTKSASDAKEPVAGQHQTLRSRGPGSSQKTVKASYEKAKETCSRLSAKESLASLGPDLKAEWKLLLEKRNSLIHANSKYKFASADELTSDEEVLEEAVSRILCGRLKAVFMVQQGLSGWDISSILAVSRRHVEGCIWASHYGALIRSTDSVSHIFFSFVFPSSNHL